MTTRAEIEAVYDLLLKPATQIVESGRQHAPMLFRSDALGSPFPIFRLPKDFWLLAQQSVVKSKPEAFAILVNEAWTASYDEDPGKSDAPMPSEHPNRRECLLFSFLGTDWQALACCIIHRDGATVRVERAELTFLNDSEGEFSGRMIQKPNKVQ